MQHGPFLHPPGGSNKLAGRPAHRPSCARAFISPSRAGRRCDRGLLVHVDRGAAVLPGENGKIAFAGARDGNFEIYVVDPDATGVPA